MNLSEMITSELQREAAATRNVLARVPTDKLSWKPHEKSMTLGVLANHIATLPAFIAEFGTADFRDVEGLTPPPQPASTAEIVATFDQGVKDAGGIIDAMDDQAMMKDWSFRKGGQPFMTIPRVGLYRTILLNHLYHHRGQLSVYLRLLDVPVPSIYGPSADENPFG